MKNLLSHSLQLDAITEELTEIHDRCVHVVEDG